MGSPFVFPPVAFGEAHPAMTRPVSGLRRTIAAVAPAKRRPPGLRNGARATTAVERRSLSLGAPSRSADGILSGDYDGQPFYGLSEFAVRFHKAASRFLGLLLRSYSRDRERHRDYGQPHREQIDDHIHHGESPCCDIKCLMKSSTRLDSRRCDFITSSSNLLFAASDRHPNQMERMDIMRATMLTNSPIPIKRFLWQ